MTAVRRNRLTLALAAFVALVGSGWVYQSLQACPFCAAVSLTFTEEIAAAQVAVIAKLVELPPKPTGDAAQNSALDVSKAKFEVVNVLKGEDVLGKNRKIEVVYFGEAPVGATFLIMGIDPPNINWGTPIAISERGQAYVAKAITLPKEGADRMVFFQDYLEDKDEMLARDSYDEFAKVPYSSVLAMKDRMKHDQLVEWIKSPQIPVSRRRLYLTMLGVCGTPQDLPLLEEMIASKDRQTKGALDALVAAYLTLKGPDGMTLVEDLFLKNKDAEYTDTYATIMALRFHGTEEKIIPRERLLGGIRTMLDRPQLADLVIPDLARWEDWSVIDRLVELFKNSDDESSWVRVPVINYLRACPLPAAKERIDELAKLDPDTVKRANTFFPLAGAAPAADDKSKTAEKKDDKEKAKPAEEASKPAPADKPAADKAPAASAPAVRLEKPAIESQPAEKKAASTESEDSTIVAAAPLSKNPPTAPSQKAASVPVFVGLSAAAILLACAFWAILKGGQHATG